jgi:hypothetical protein
MTDPKINMSINTGRSKSREIQNKKNENYLNINKILLHKSNFREGHTKECRMFYTLASFNNAFDQSHRLLTKTDH